MRVLTLFLLSLFFSVSLFSTNSYAQNGDAGSIAKCIDLALLNGGNPDELADCLNIKDGCDNNPPGCCNPDGTPVDCGPGKVCQLPCDGSGVGTCIDPGDVPGDCSNIQPSEECPPPGDPRYEEALCEDGVTVYKKTCKVNNKTCWCNPSGNECDQGTIVYACNTITFEDGEPCPATTPTPTETPTPSPTPTPGGGGENGSNGGTGINGGFGINGGTGINGGFGFNGGTGTGGTGTGGTGGVGGTGTGGTGTGGTGTGGTGTGGTGTGGTGTGGTGTGGTGTGGTGTGGTGTGGTGTGGTGTGGTGTGGTGTGGTGTGGTGTGGTGTGGTGTGGTGTGGTGTGGTGTGGTGTGGTGTGGTGTGGTGTGGTGTGGTGTGGTGTGGTGTGGTGTGGTGTGGTGDMGITGTGGTGTTGGSGSTGTGGSGSSGSSGTQGSTETGFKGIAGVLGQAGFGVGDNTDTVIVPNDNCSAVNVTPKLYALSTAFQGYNGRLAKIRLGQMSKAVLSSEKAARKKTVEASINKRFANYDESVTRALEGIGTVPGVMVLCSIPPVGCTEVEHVGLKVFADNVSLSEKRVQDNFKQLKNGSSARNAIAALMKKQAAVRFVPQIAKATKNELLKLVKEIPTKSYICK